MKSPIPFFDNFSELKKIIHETAKKTDKDILLILNNGTVKAKPNDFIFSWTIPETESDDRPITSGRNHILDKKGNKEDFQDDNFIVVWNALCNINNQEFTLKEILININKISAFTIV